MPLKFLNKLETKRLFLQAITGKVLFYYMKAAQKKLITGMNAVTNCAQK